MLGGRRNLWLNTVPMSLFKQWPFFSASCLDQVLITQERPKQRHFRQRDIKSGCSTMEILDFQQSCSSAVARAFTQPQFLCSFPCPVGRFQRPASLSTQAVTGWWLGPHVAEVQNPGPGSSAVPWLGVRACPLQPSAACRTLRRAAGLPLLLPAAGLLKGTRASSAISICDSVQIPTLNPGLSSLFFT